MTTKRDTKSIVAMFKNVHGEKYDYSLVDYVGYETKVNIVCKVHGVFAQTPHSHLNGRGCPYCGRESARQKKAVGSEEFVKRAREVHGDKYDYSKVIYMRKNYKACIICPIHGEFWQSPDNHVNQRQGCPTCGRISLSEKQSMTTEEFVEKATNVHGGKYSYEHTVYTRSNQPVCVTCKTHGDFWQSANSHLRGSGCPICGIEETKNKTTKSTKEFIEHAKKVHGDRYLFDHTEYHGHHSKVCITCREHGDVWVYACNLLKGGGCPLCAHKSVSKKLASNTEEFIKKAKEKHGDKYDYSKVVYVNNKVPVEIICKRHGVFLQTPHMHLMRTGCPQCGCSLGEERVALFLDRNNIKYLRQYPVPNNILFCKNKTILIDFFLYEYSVAIEFNGEQHYRPIKFFGGEETFHLQQERDMSLRQYCHQHKIKLIEIPYSDIHNIDAIISKELKRRIKNH